MSDKRPKFCVGEEVMIRSESCPEQNTDKTEVVEASQGYPGTDRQLVAALGPDEATTRLGLAKSRVLRGGP